jgi:transposase-like protein
MRFHPEQVAAALTGFYEGLSLDAIGRSLRDETGIAPSDATIYEWVARFTEQGIRALEGMRGDVGRIWVVDETVLHVAGKEAWFWDIIAEETRFLVASHLTYARTREAAKWLFKQAIQRVNRVPLQIQTDGLNVYPEAIEQVFGGATRHIPSHGFDKRPNTNLIERFHSTLKQRTKVMRGLQNLQTARLLLDGWLMHYNFFRPHETLNGRTPAQAAELAFRYASWRDVVMDGHIPTRRKVNVTVTNL